LSGGLFKIFLGIIALSPIILIHEFGHYLAAVLSGIRVETFSIGFGKRLFGFRRGETDYRISLIPMGGYCRFSGEQSFRRALDEKMDFIPGDKGEFYGSSAVKRILVSFAGPFANIIFAVLVFTLISWIGFQEYYTDPRIILVSELSDSRNDWPSNKAGLETGDYIVSVDGRAISRFDELRRYLVFQSGKELDLTVKRNGKLLNLNITPELDKASGVALIGVLNWVDPIISVDQPEYHIVSGDRILSVDDQEILNTVGFYATINNSENSDNNRIFLSIERNGRQIELEIEDISELIDSLTFQLLSVRSKQMNGFTALAEGIRETYDKISLTFQSLHVLFMGIELQNAVSGPIRMITDTGAVVVEGFSNGFGPGLLWSFKWLAFISISLGFLNMLPIPALDGGQILLFLFEILQRKKLNPKLVYRYQFVGTIVILIIFAAALTGDLIHFNSL